jgi:hypothetical protein
VLKKWVTILNTCGKINLRNLSGTPSSLIAFDLIWWRALNTFRSKVLLKANLYEPALFSTILLLLVLFCVVKKIKDWKIDGKMLCFIENFMKERTLRVARHTKWGANQQNLIKIHQMVVLSTIRYGEEAYGSASQVILRQLEPTHNSTWTICNFPNRKRLLRSQHPYYGRNRGIKKREDDDMNDNKPNTLHATLQRRP